MIAVFPNVIAIASRQELHIVRVFFFFNTVSRINDMKRPLVLQLFGARKIFRPRIVLSFNRISDIKSIYGSLEPPSGRYPFFEPEKTFFSLFFCFNLQPLLNYRQTCKLNGVRAFLIEICINSRYIT